MSMITCWFRRVMARSWQWAVICIPIGAVLGWGIALQMAGGQRPLVIQGLHEADGIIAKGGQIDLLGVRTGGNPCPGATQRYLWREIEVDGAKVRQLVPLPMTVLPAFMSNGPIMLTLPVPVNMPDGHWYYRAVTMENCSWLPGWLSGSQIRQTVDVPVEVKG